MRANVLSMSDKVCLLTQASCAIWCMGRLFKSIVVCNVWMRISIVDGGMML